MIRLQMLCIFNSQPKHYLIFASNKILTIRKYNIINRKVFLIKFILIIEEYNIKIFK